VPQPSHPNSVIASMTQQHCHQHHSASTSHHDQVVLVAPSPALLGSIITNMTRHLHHAMTNVTSTVASPTGINSVIISMTWSHRHQHDSASTSHDCVTPTFCIIKLCQAGSALGCIFGRFNLRKRFSQFNLA
jgi:hypothetical protein